jgi:hypothetical protein
MRFLFGLVIGVLIAIGGAYVHDASVSPTMSGPDSTGSRMVNWDAVSHSFNRLADATRDDFNRLMGRPRHDAPISGA